MVVLNRYYIQKMSNLIENCGWTISNRRMLQSVIGSAEMEKFAATYKKLSPSEYVQRIVDIPELSDNIYKVRIGRYHNSLFKLHSDGKDIWLKLGVEIEGTKTDIPDLKFVNNEITLENIRNRIIKLKESIIANMKKVKPVERSTLEKSKTLEKLFSKKFTVHPQLNEDGYYVTTIIKRSNNQPTLAYIKELHRDGAPANKKIWGLFIKHKNGSYEQLGSTSYFIKEAEKKFTSGWMDTYSGQGEYAGIGVRLHEWRIAQALKMGFNKVEIIALDEAFPFHYKCGFRSPNIWEEGSLPQLDELVKFISKETGMSAEEIEKFLIKKYLPNGRISLNMKSRENIWIETLCKQGKACCDQEGIMVMEGENLELWRQRMNEQPILPE